MKKHFPLIFAIFCLFAANIHAQNPNKVTIKGIVKDTLGEKIPFATVMLLSPKDTTLVNFTRSDNDGVFSFKNVKNNDYLLKITYISYLPFQLHLYPNTTETNDLGNVTIKPISEALMEVVIRAAKAPLRIRGDTIEYDATTFKVPPGSSVEDLLRRLPGIEVDADGNIKSQGKDVNKVYVDGKTFFGDDPKNVTKNLDAQAISKVQVYNEKSEQSKLTGVDDGKKEKAMNLELKEEYKRGSFGKITAAAGTENRWAGRGNYNRFNEKQQLSFITYGNNINQTGVNWEDYGEFKGQNTFGNQDNGDFGFNRGGGRYYWSSDDDSPLNNFDGRGFTDNFGAGSNYNFDNKKSKFNANYFYNQTDLTLDEDGFRQTFLQDSSFSNSDTTMRNNFRGKHSFGTRLEHNIDSNDVIIVKADFRFSRANDKMVQSQFFKLQNDAPNNSLTLDNQEQKDNLRLSSSAIFRHRFKKQGRSFAMSAGYNNSQSDGTENLFSLNKFFGATTFAKQIKQLNVANSATIQYKSSALYTNSLAKYWFWETFYNFSQSNNQVNRQVQDPTLNNARIENLSVYFNNNLMYNRLGSSVRYSKNGMNTSIGLAAQQIRLNSEYATDKGLPLLTAPLERIFNNFTPNIDFNYEFPNNLNVSSSYNYEISEPDLSDLQPVPNVNNPAFRTLGNPELSPGRAHNIGINLNYWNAANFSHMGINGDLRLFDSQIVYNQTIEQVDSIGIRTTTMPVNVKGGYNYSSWVWSGFPIVKTKLTANINGGINFGNSFSSINNIENETNEKGIDFNFGLNGTPNQKIILGLSANIGFKKIQYSIQKEQNQDIINNGIDASIKWQVVSKTFFESNFDYSLYRNDRYNFNRSIPIWNASIRRLFGKNNKLEMRLAAFDLLNKRVSISQYASQNFVSRQVAGTLARYFMLSASYNLKGYENKLNKNRWM
jgi:Outer membrane protein beta-barrel family/Carboxypeptidase regulatory-like domain